MILGRELLSSHLKSILLVVSFIFIFIFFISIDASQSFAISAPFPLQQINDGQNDWIDMAAKQPAIHKGAFAPDYMGITDIEAVSYFSDGKILNATLWTYLPFKAKPTKYEQVNYGMLIDSDFDKNTGYGGIDYLFQLGWNNNTTRWDKSLWELSPTGENKTLVYEHNFTGFYEKQKPYVVLPLNLSYLHYPEKYKVTFYAEVKRKGHDSFFTDFTRTVAIPPLKLDISTIPTSLTIRPGESKTITLRINSTSGFEPTVYLSTPKNQSGDITSTIKFSKIRIPSYGTATIPMTISSAQNTPRGAHTIFIFADSTFPPENQIKQEFMSKSSIPSSNTNPFIPQSEEKSQNVLGQSTMLITVLDPLNWQDQISEFWSKVGNSIQFFYGILAGISPWIFSKLKNKLKATKD
jgi:hypothetical protein